ncbi:MAG: hypothetical protein P8Z31_06000 [Gammaproteobacteria bacterium]
MKTRHLLLLLLGGALAACGDSGTAPEQEKTMQPDQPPSVTEELKQKSAEWLDATKELGATAAEAAKEQGARLRDQTETALDEAKEKSKELAGQAEEAAREWSDWAREAIDQKLEELEQEEQQAPAGEPPKQIAL